MSVRYGDKVIAGKVQVDETPTLGSTRPVSSDGVYRTCANRDADNFTDDGQKKITVIGYPDVTRAVSLTPLASGAEYTAPKNGWFYTIVASGGTYTYSYIRYSANLSDMFRFLDWKPNSGGGLNVWCPVKAGEVVSINYSTANTLTAVYFIPAYGQE